MERYYITKLDNVSLYTCPNCGNHHSIREWNKATEEYFEGEITPIEHSELENIFVCPTCMEENSRGEIDEATERQLKCPNCGKDHSLLQWDKTTLKDFGSPIRSLFSAPGDYYTTCPSCRRVLTAEEVREANDIKVYA